MKMLHESTLWLNLLQHAQLRACEKHQRMDVCKMTSHTSAEFAAYSQCEVLTMQRKLAT
jgi:hypothetical protein